MRALLQRVRQASVTVEGREVGACGPGLLVFLGVGRDDTHETAERLWRKVHALRIFADEAGKTNRSLADVGGEVLIVSQFTLYADCRRGHRPSFTDAAGAEQGRALYETFCACAEHDVAHVGRGAFGEMMDVSLVNDGPFTIWLSTD